MGEGAARAITIVSIILTVASLALAVAFARKRSRIRVGFDLARAVVGIAAILVMAAVTQVTTPTVAIVAAVLVGAGLGFAQGSSLEISPGEKGFYAQRSPLGIALWGAGIVIMQGAGMASRTGTVRIGQTIAWFSACIGIGLMVGRNGPLEHAKKALAGAGVAALVAVLVAPALIAGMANPAVAQSELTAEDLCAFAPYQTLDLDAGDGLGDERADLGPATVDGIKYCARTFGGYIEDGQRYNADTVSIYLYPSTAAATASFDETANAMAFTMLDIGIGDRYMEIGTLGDLDFLAMGQRGPFIFQIYSWFEFIPAREAMLEIDANVAPFVTGGGASASTTSTPDGATTTTVTSGGGATTTTTDTQSVTATTEATGTGRSPSSGDAEEPIEPEEAAGQAIAGLIAAAAIGAITWAEAAAEIGRILGGLGSGATPPIQTRTVVISGADAESIINGGPGSSVGIPSDQQWDSNVSVPGQPPVTEGRVGSVGIVRSVGPIVRGPDGTVSVSVEVDAFDPAPPPPPPPDPKPWPMPDIDEIYEPSPLPDPLPPRPPPVEPPPMPDIDEIYEPSPLPDPLPPRPPPVEPPVDEPPVEPPGLPPVDEPPPPPDDEAPPDPPADETPPEIPPDREMPPVEEGPPGDEGPAGDELPPDDEPPDDELEDGPPDGPAPAVILDPEEIEEWVRWGVERNRSPEDILQDIEGYNQARGGTGPVELPETLVQVDTPAGPVTVTAAEAARHDAAAAEMARLSRDRDALRGEMAKLDEDAAWWGGAERLAGERLLAGTSEMMTRINTTEARIDEINDEIARLSRRPDPMIWDFQRAGMATREEAFESWENRHSHGWHHDQIQRLQAEQNSLNSQLTEDLGAFRTTAADDVRLENARGRLADIENGTRPPERIDFETQSDPEESYYDALEEWRTRETSGRYFDEAERLRGEIAARESLTHVSDVEPARPGDRGTIFDRPARELARIAEEQDRTMADYREVDGKIDAAQQILDGIASRANRR